MIKQILQSSLCASALFAAAAFANETAAPAPVKEAAPVHEKADHPVASKKLTFKVARQECLKENAGMKGKALNECVKGKRKAE